MSGYNKVILMGNLTRDPELKQLPSGSDVINFSIAVSRKYKTKAGEQKEETAFVDCAAFGGVAGVINNFFSKGKPILVEGRLRQEQWEDKSTGQKRSKLSVTVDSFEFVGGREQGNDGQSGGNNNTGNKQDRDHTQNLKDDDIPF